MSWLRRNWWIIPLVAAALAGLAIVFGPRPSTQTGPVADTRCAPKPCAAPHGFEVDVSKVSSAAGVVSLEISFKNHTLPGGGRVNDYNHSAPGDFSLRQPGRRIDPVFSPTCPDWGDVKVPIGATAGVFKLCFPALLAPGTRLAWSPDLGLLFDEVDIPLN